MSTTPQNHGSPAGSSDTVTNSKKAIQQDVSDALPPPPQHSEFDSSAPIVHNHSMPSDGPYGQLPGPPRSAVASAAVETIQQQEGSMLAQSAATSAAPTLGAPFPAIHAIETIMALESGLRIDPVLYDLIHGPHDVFTQNIGRYQQQQRLYQQNNAYDPKQSNNAYLNNPFNNHVQQHPRHAAGTPAPQSRATHRCAP